MSFNPNIPQSTDDLSDSQGDLLQNNLALDASFGRDHLPFSNLTADNGKHKFVEMVSATLPAPVPGLSAGSGTIYTKSVGTPTESQVFYTPDASGAEFQLTRALSASSTLFGTNTAYGTPPVGFSQAGGYTFLPGGLLLQYGLISNIGMANSGTATISFPVNFTGAPFCVMVSWRTFGNATQASTLGVNTTTFTNSAFGVTWIGGTGYTGISWIAIGV